MMKKNKRQNIKAIGLISGGLDSLLATKVIRDQGIEVIGVCVTSPFFGSSGARKSARALGIPIKVIDVSEPYMAILKGPRYGFGKCMNPCIDCHGLMVREAGKVMKEVGASFVFTGEVLGQRPMSQRRDALRCVEKLSGIDGYLLRPLSAKLLPPTIPEEQGIVNRETLLDIQGRSRKRQQALAQTWGITEYESPGGGCMLTKEGFSRKLKELLETEKEITIPRAELLKLGRHFRLLGGSKLVIGRNKKENEVILSIASREDIILKTLGVPGPIGYIPRYYDSVTNDEIVLAAKTVAAYSDAPPGMECSVVISKGEREGVVRVTKKNNAEFRKFMI